MGANDVAVPVIVNEEGFLRVVLDPISGGEETHAIAAFSDRDLAERFLAWQDDPELVAVCLSDPEEFIAMLRRAIRRGETMLVFDPPNGPVVAAISELVEAMETLVADGDAGSS